MVVMLKDKATIKFDKARQSNLQKEILLVNILVCTLIFILHAGLGRRIYIHETIRLAGEHAPIYIFSG